MYRNRMSNKLRLMVLARILLEETDDGHYLTRTKINKLLSEAGFEIPDGDTFSDDIRLLSEFGIDIIKEKVGRECRYHVGQRTFELAELKVIVDIVQSSRFINENKSQELINKIEKLASRYDAEKLERQVYVNDRIKSDNTHVFYIVDKINEALIEKKMVGFLYYEIIARKKQRENGEVYLDLEKSYRHEKKLYKVSPWALISNNQNYYLVGCTEKGDIRHYRIDRMDKVEMLDTPAETNNLKSFNVAEYAQKHFEMFSGEECEIDIRFEDNLAFIICDRFGNDIRLRTAEGNRLEATVRVCVNNQFLSWILSLGNGVLITGPEKVVGQMRKLLKDGAEKYGL